MAKEVKRQHKKMLTQLTGRTPKKHYASGNLGPKAGIMQTPQAESGRKIDEYTQRSKNINKQVKPIVGWVKNVKVQLNLNNEDRKVNPASYKGQLSQRGLHMDKQQRSISSIKIYGDTKAQRQLKTQGSAGKPQANDDSKLEDNSQTSGQTRKLEQLRQIVVSQGVNQGKRSISSESNYVFLTPAKLAPSSCISNKEQHRKVESISKEKGSIPIRRVNINKRKKDAGTGPRNMTSLYTSPRPAKDELTPVLNRDAVVNAINGEICEKYGAATERVMQRDLEVRTVDKMPDGTSLGLPDDSNYNRMVSFMEDLKQSIEVPRKKHPGLGIPYAKPAIAIQNFGFTNKLFAKSRSLKTLQRVVMDRSVAGRVLPPDLKRCETPNDLHPASLFAKPSAFSTTSSPHRDHLTSTGEKPKIGSVIFPQTNQYATEDIVKPHFSSIYGFTANNKDYFPEDAVLNNTRTDEAVRTVDQRKLESPLSNNTGFAEQLNMKLQEIIISRTNNKEKYMTVGSPRKKIPKINDNIGGLKRPTKPVEKKKEDHQKFRLARKLYTKGPCAVPLSMSHNIYAK